MAIKYKCIQKVQPGVAGGGDRKYYATIVIDGEATVDDLVGYRQVSLNRQEHYPHGMRDRQDVYDTTGNILIDYTLFGFENILEELVVSDKW